MKVQNYRFHCRNQKCGAEFLRRYRVDEFEKNQYHTENGWGCFNCGYPRMAVMKSEREVKDGFQPGYYRCVMKYCRTYTELKEARKAKGLVEIGYDEIKDPESENEAISYWSDDILKKVYEHGVKLSGLEAEALKTGELLKD